MPTFLINYIITICSNRKGCIVYIYHYKNYVVEQTKLYLNTGLEYGLNWAVLKQAFGIGVRTIIELTLFSHWSMYLSHLYTIQRECMTLWTLD